MYITKKKNDPKEACFFMWNDAGELSICLSVQWMNLGKIIQVILVEECRIADTPFSTLFCFSWNADIALVPTPSSEYLGVIQK